MVRNQGQSLRQNSHNFRIVGGFSTPEMAVGQMKIRHGFSTEANQQSNVNLNQLSV